MVGVLRLYQSGMGGGGHLPEDILDQPVLMLTALNLMASFEAKLTAKDAKPLNEDGEEDIVAMEKNAAQSWGVMV